MKIKAQAQASHSRLLLDMQYNAAEVPFPIAVPFWYLTGMYRAQPSEIHRSAVIMQRTDMNPERAQPAGQSRAVREGNRLSLGDLLGLIRPADGLGSLLY